jgi:hypothetical protein
VKHYHVLGFWLVIEFLEHLQLVTSISKGYAVTVLHNVQFTIACTQVFSVSCIFTILLVTPSDGGLFPFPLGSRNVTVPLPQQLSTDWQTNFRQVYSTLHWQIFSLKYLAMDRLETISEFDKSCFFFLILPHTHEVKKVWHPWNRLWRCNFFGLLLIYGKYIVYIWFCDGCSISENSEPLRPVNFRLYYQNNSVERNYKMVSWEAHN